MASFGVTLLIISVISLVLALVGFLFPGVLKQQSRGASLVGFGGLAVVMFGLMFLVAPKKSNDAEVTLKLPAPTAAVAEESKAGKS